MGSLSDGTAHSERDENDGLEDDGEKKKFVKLSKANKKKKNRDDHDGENRKIKKKNK